MPRFATACLLASCLFLASCETTDVTGIANAVLAPGGGDQLPIETVVAGLKEALRVGTANAVDQTAIKGGFADNVRLRIKSPKKIRKVTDTMRKFGLGHMVDDFEGKMNVAAEQAAGEAGDVFLTAVRGMTIADGYDILRGDDDAATEYFRGKTEDELRRRFGPIVRKHMQSVGALEAYNNLIARYHQIPLVPRADFDADEYVTDEALNGLFTVLADEEKKIRDNPAARTTELLRTVFGNR
jgi:hypothetical protein